MVNVETRQSREIFELCGPSANKVAVVQKTLQVLYDDFLGSLAIAEQTDRVVLTGTHEVHKDHVTTAGLHSAMAQHWSMPVRSTTPPSAADFFPNGDMKA